MTKPEHPKPAPLPVLLVYGKSTSADLPQAAWFRAEHRPAVAAAAQALKLSVVEIKTEAELAWIAGVHEGVLKAGGRMIIGSVALAIYRRIEEHMRKATDASTAAVAGSEKTEVKPPAEQNKNPPSKDITAPPPGVAAAAPTPGDKPAATSALAPTGPQAVAAPAADPWDALIIGSHVVGKYWESDGNPYGWWIGVITGIDKSDFIVRWPDEPKKPPAKIERQHVAILHPTFDVNYEWVRRR